MKTILIVLALIQIGYSQNTYTVKEIDELRTAIKARYLFGTTYFKLPPIQVSFEKGFDTTWSSTTISRQSCSYKETEMTAVVEQQLRTYMQAGIKAKDIYEEDERKVNK